jgi:hypothetical protein
LFVGHYGVSFAAKRSAPSVPLWVLFIAVQLLDVIWAPLVLLGIEKLSIVPGITASNSLFLYYMPYTHSLVGAILWSAGAFVVYRLVAGRERDREAFVVSIAVFSHWILDFLVHRPDLPLYDNTSKVGLGLWNYRILALVLEAAVLFGGMAWYLRTRTNRRAAFLVFGIALVAVQVRVSFGPPPTSERAEAWSALVAYAAFAGIIAALEGRRRPLAQKPNAAG